MISPRLKRTFGEILELVDDRRFERVFILLALFLASGAVFPLWRQETGFERDEFRGDPLVQLIWIGMYVILILLVAVRWREVLATALRGKLILLLVGLVCASILWSFAPEVTFRRSVALTMTTLFGAYLATRYSIREQLTMFAGVLGFAGVLSLLFVLAFPQYGLGTGPNEGAWEGIFLQKNVLGRYMAFGAMAFFILAAGRYVNPAAGWAGFVLCGLLVLLSDSTTALLSLLVFAALFAIYVNFRRVVSPSRLIFVLCGLAGTAFAVLLINLSPVLGFFGKSITLTGRTGLWNVVTTQIGYRPALGYGYGGFWLGEEGPSGRVWRALNWEPTHAHNGFLEIMLGVGVVGLLVFLTGFLFYLLRALVWAHAAGELLSLWPVAFFVSLVLYSSTQSVLMEQNNILWIFYVATALSIPVSLRSPGQPVTLPRWARRSRRVR
jgi:exopolysaccharide production protein ExoQ